MNYIQEVIYYIPFIIAIEIIKGRIEMYLNCLSHYLVLFELFVDWKAMWRHLPMSISVTLEQRNNHIHIFVQLHSMLLLQTLLEGRAMFSFCASQEEATRDPRSDAWWWTRILGFTIAMGREVDVVRTVHGSAFHLPKLIIWKFKSFAFHTQSFLSCTCDFLISQIISGRGVLLGSSSLESCLVFDDTDTMRWRIQLDAHLIAVGPDFAFDVADEVTRKTVPCFLGRRRQEHLPFDGHEHRGLHQEQITTMIMMTDAGRFGHLAVECRFAHRGRQMTLLIRTPCNYQSDRNEPRVSVWANGRELDESVKTATLHEKTLMELQEHSSKKSWSTADQAHLNIGEIGDIKNKGTDK